MPRRPHSQVELEAQAREASRRMIPQGGRPTFRIRASTQGSWTVEWCPWLPSVSGSRAEAADAARTVISAWLDVEATAFDIELAETW